MGKFRVTILGVVAVIVLVIIFQNMAVVETKLLFVTIEMPRAFLLALTALGGFITGLLVAVRFR